MRGGGGEGRGNLFIILSIGETPPHSSFLIVFAQCRAVPSRDSNWGPLLSTLARDSCSVPLLGTLAQYPCSGHLLGTLARDPCSGPLLRTLAQDPCTGPLLRTYLEAGAICLPGLSSHAYSIICLRFLGIILRSLRLGVSVWIS